MSATENEIAGVFKWLLTSHHITVNGEWLEACISWLKQQNNGTMRVPLTDQVYEQWLMSDLSESGTGCLPQQICTVGETELHGYYALQMNSIVNVGESAYSQWKKLKGETLTECESKQEAWQPKPTRMLMLELTDGDQIVQGMEHIPNKQLYSGLTPGTKILIKGKARCMMGIIFLSENNFKILGGQVESLIEENSQINVLHRLVMKDKQTKRGDSQEREGISRIQMTNINDDDVEREMMEQLNKIEENIQRKEGSQVVDEVGKRDEIFKVEIGNNSRKSMKENLPPMQIFENVKRKENIASVNGTIFNQRRMDLNTTQRTLNQQGTGSTATVTVNNETKDDEIVNDEDFAAFISDDDSLLANLTYRDDVGLTECQRRRVPLESVEGAFDGVDEIEDISDGVLSSLDEAGHLKLEGEKYQTKSANDYIYEFENILEKGKVNSNFLWKDHSCTDVGNKQSSKKVNTSKNLRNSKRQTTLNQFTTRAPDDFIDLTDESDFEINPKTVNHSSKSKKIHSKKSVKHEKTTEMVHGNVCSSLGLMNTAGKESDKDGSFTYLSKVLTQIPPPRKTTVQVKAYISTLFPRVMPISPPEWNIRAKINDGSCVAEVDVGYEVLDKIFGMSARNFQRKIEESSRNPTLAEEFTKWVSAKEQYLANIVSLMTLELSPMSFKPRLVKVQKPTKDHIEQLFNKVHDNLKKS